ncbi:MAG: hypothetical protein ACK4X1_15650 [Terricaulis sp.]
MPECDDFDDFVSLLLGADERGLILALRAYFDDAGTHDAARVVCWGGFIGNAKQWRTLETAWRERLANPILNTLDPKPPLARFHLSPCRARDDEYAGYSEANANSLRYDFREIISKSGVVGVAFAIDRRAYNLIVPINARDYLGDAEQVCFGACFNGAYQQARQFYPHETQLHLIFDRVTHASRREKLEATAARVEQEEGGKPRLISATWADMTATPALQAADTIATENTWFAQDYLADEKAKPSAHLQHMLRTVDCLGHIMREEEVRAYVRKYGYTPAA